jgi:hypothetical protein
MKSYSEIEKEIIWKEKENLAKLHDKLKEQQNKVVLSKSNCELEKQEYQKIKTEFTNVAMKQATEIREAFKSELKKEFLPDESDGVANLVYDTANRLTDVNDHIVSYYEDLVIFIKDLREIEQFEKENNKINKE